MSSEHSEHSEHSEVTATVTMRFAVVDTELLEGLAAAATDKYGLGVELEPGNAGQQIYEVLLASNPAIGAFLDFGIELLDVETATHKGGR